LDGIKAQKYEYVVGKNDASFIHNDNVGNILGSMVDAIQNSGGSSFPSPPPAPPSATKVTTKAKNGNN